MRKTASKLAMVAPPGDDDARESRPLNEPTYLRIKRAIVADLIGAHFRPGDHLTIDMLTSRYRVSHMPIREALRQLEGEGIRVDGASRLSHRSDYRRLYSQHLRYPGRDRIHAGPPGNRAA